VHDFDALPSDLQFRVLLADRGEQYRIEFPLQQVIQVAVDLAAHVMADSPGGSPNTIA
jgi:uncharacterized protein YutE (UPF0331/DUF86 family)